MADKTHQEFEDLLNAWSAAIVSNDASSIGSFMSDDWIIIGETGVTTREDFLKLVESGDLTHEKMNHKAHTVRIYGDTAVVVSRGTNNGMFNGQPFTNDEWVTDVFVKKDNRFLCVLTHLTAAQEK